MSLAEPHAFAPGGVKWAVTPAGISIAGAAPVGTGGEPVTARRVLAWYARPIAGACTAFGVPRPLIIAIICNESAGGQPDRALVEGARREEPGFVSDSATPYRVSMGCCQTLLSTARQALRDPTLTSADLADPAISIRACAAYVARQRLVTSFDPVLVAAGYNAGGLYLDTTPANRWKLRCFPLGTGAYIDRFVRWYNDAVTVA